MTLIAALRTETCYLPGQLALGILPESDFGIVRPRVVVVTPSLSPLFARDGRECRVEELRRTTPPDWTIIWDLEAVEVEEVAVSRTLGRLMQPKVLKLCQKLHPLAWRAGDDL